MTTEILVRSKPIFSVICGSQLYGLETPTSDVDHGRVYVDPKEHIFGFSRARRRIKQLVSEEEDVNGHWLREFCDLCQKGNPNAIEWLWAHEGCTTYVHPTFQRHILDNADAFIGLVGLSNSHFGFALSQLKKMKVITGKVGKKRRDFVHKYGYDIKFASHAIRLMYQLMELVNTGKVIYPIVDERHGELLRIKTGKVSEQEVVDLFNRLRDDCNAAIEKNTAEIPEHADKARINQMLIDFFEEYYYA